MKERKEVKEDSENVDGLPKPEHCLNTTYSRKKLLCKINCFNALYAFL